MEVYLGLGSNLGDRAQNLRTALSKLPPDIIVEAVSPVYETEPQYLKNQPEFLNIACKCKTALSARAVLTLIKKVETDLGRVETERFGPRTIDIDLLFYGQERVNEPDLIVPHPQLSERAFVLIPLADIAPDFVHPALRSTIQSLREKLSEITGVKKTPITL